MSSFMANLEAAAGSTGITAQDDVWHSALSVHPSHWSVDDVCLWACQAEDQGGAGLPGLSRSLAANCVDGAMLLQLTPDDIRVHLQQDAEAALQAVARLKQLSAAIAEGRLQLVSLQPQQDPNSSDTTGHVPVAMLTSGPSYAAVGSRSQQDAAGPLPQTAVADAGCRAAVRAAKELRDLQSTYSSLQRQYKLLHRGAMDLDTIADQQHATASAAGATGTAPARVYRALPAGRRRVVLPWMARLLDAAEYRRRKAATHYGSQATAGSAPTLRSNARTVSAKHVLKTGRRQRVQHTLKSQLASELVTATVQQKQQEEQEEQRLRQQRQRQPPLYDAASNEQQDGASFAPSAMLASMRAAATELDARKRLGLTAPSQGPQMVQSAADAYRQQALYPHLTAMAASAVTLPYSSRHAASSANHSTQSSRRARVAASAAPAVADIQSSQRQRTHTSAPAAGTQRKGPATLPAWLSADGRWAHTQLRRQGVAVPRPIVPRPLHSTAPPAYGFSNGRLATIRGRAAWDRETAEHAQAAKAATKARHAAYTQSAGRGGNGALHWAAAQGDAAAVRTMLKSGGRGSSGSSGTRASSLAGRTPLHKAAASSAGGSNVVQQLLAAGADPDARDAQGDTPLHACIGAAPTSTAMVARVHALLHAGADPDALNHKGLAPLHCAVQRCSPGAFAGVVQELAAHGAQLSIATTDADGAAALHMAASQPNARAPMLHMLLQAGADPCTSDANGTTPLHALLRAVALKQLQSGAGRVPANSLQSRGVTAGRRNGSRLQELKAVLASVEQLLLHGADPCVVDGAGRSPVELASSCGEAAGALLKLLRKPGAGSSRP